MIKGLVVVAALAASSVVGFAQAAPLGWASDPSCGMVGQYVMSCGRSHTEAPVGLAWASAPDCSNTGQYVVPCGKSRTDPAATAGLHESCELRGQYVMPCARRSDGRQ